MNYEIKSINQWNFTDIKDLSLNSSAGNLFQLDKINN